MSLELYIKMPIDYFMIEIANCDMTVGYGNNLGEIKTYLMQQVLQNQDHIQLYVFCSDDKGARAGISGTTGIPCISAISSFYENGSIATMSFWVLYSELRMWIEITNGKKEGAAGRSLLFLSVQ